MPLPFIAAIPAIIAAASTTTLVVGGAVAAAVTIGTIVSVRMFYKKIQEWKKERKADKAVVTKIKKQLKTGDYVICKVSLRDKKGRTLETIERKVKDPNNELKVGMII